jgi:hypothetical protein
MWYISLVNLTHANFTLGLLYFANHCLKIWQFQKKKKPGDLNDFGTFLFTKILCVSCTGFCFGYQVANTCQKKEHTGGDALTIQIPYFS